MKEANIGIIMIGHGEPEIFDEKVWEEGLHEMFEELRKTGIETPPDDAIPMMLPMIKEKYETIGGRSRHAEFIRKQCELVAKQFPDYTVRYGFNEFINPHFSEVAQEVVGNGIRSLIFVSMMQTDSSHTGEIKKKIEDMHLGTRGVKWIMSKPLFYRPEPTQLVIDMIIKAAGDMPFEQVGVVLASHGEPDKWTETSFMNTKCNEQETAFTLCVKKGLIERGFIWENIVRGFNEFTRPELTEAVELLSGRSIKKVIVASTFGSTDCIHVNYDIPAKVKSAMVDPYIEIVCLDGWNEDPLIIKAYVELAKEALARLYYRAP
ncbi:MAG: ferrochelatase [Proteobacteria bacterium]|nr:ferrochelatase [Pseudomonadota bacterium]